VGIFETERIMALGTRGLAVAVIGLGALVAFTRLKSGSAGLGPKAGALQDAVLAAPIPVFPGAKLRDVTGGTYYDDIGGPVTFTSKSWFFEVATPTAEVADYYRKNLPAGCRPAEAEDGAVSFEWIPPGAAEGEDVSVTVREGELQITETVKARSTA
jgi:hypothetical protein